MCVGCCASEEKDTAISMRERKYLLGWHTCGALACGKESVEGRMGRPARAAQPYSPVRNPRTQPTDCSGATKLGDARELPPTRRARGGAELIPMILRRAEIDRPIGRRCACHMGQYVSLWRACRKPAHDMPANPQQQNKNEKMCPKAPKLSHFVWTTDRMRPEAQTALSRFPFIIADRIQVEIGTEAAWIDSHQSSSLSIPLRLRSKQCGSSQSSASELMCLGSISTGSNPTDPSITINAHMDGVQRVEIPCLLAWIPPDDARRWLTLGFASSNF